MTNDAARYAELPATWYRSEERFRTELDRVFGATWLSTVRLDTLPERGALPYTVGQRDIVISRDGDEVRAFHNACAHRGSAVLGERSTGGQLRCPYHGWVYGLDGALRTVPGEELFTDLDRTACGLPSVTCASWAGWLWVNFVPTPQPLERSLASMAEEVNNYRLETQVSHARREDEVDLNWKAALDAFNEVYHVPFIHRGSVGRLVAPTQSDFRYYGSHSRMSVPVRQTLDEAQGRTDAPAPAGPLGKQLLPEQAAGHVNYLFFPTTIGDLTPTWGIWFRFEPLTVGRTRISAEMLTDPPGSDRQSASFDRHWAELCKVLDEDYEAMRMIGRGMRSEGFQVARLGGAEERLIRFHAEVDHLVRGEEHLAPRPR